MGSIFKPKTPTLPPVQPAPPPPVIEPPVVKEKGMTEAEKKEIQERDEKIAKEQAAIERRRKGRKSTILTGPLGLQESEEEKLKTLLGE